MCGEGGNWIIHNGEIYNFPELREELRALGYTLHTATDTEVILAAYAAWGEDCVSRFNGMWAFALYDVSRQTLFLSRDRLGIKPLYYTLHQGCFAFASEIAPLLALPGKRPRIAAPQLIRYLVDHRTDWSAETVYTGILELRGAHCLRLDLRSGETRLWRFWDFPEASDLELDDDQALERFSELIEDSVRLRLRSDVPVAVTLSGGVDSSVVAVAASRVAQNGVSAFTSRFPDFPAIDESGFAGQVCRARGINHTLIEPELSRMTEEEPDLTRHQGMPYGSLSLYVHWAILRRIRAEGIPVVLSGQGGDEGFLGYERYYVSAALSRMPNLVAVANQLVQASRKSRLSLGEAAAYLVYFSWPRLQRFRRLRDASRVYHPDLLAQLAPPEREMTGDPRQQQALEFTSLVLPALLRYDDRNSGALGMETRLPFLDYRMVEFAYRLPLRFKIRGGWSKYLSRLYLARHAPESVAWRTHKLGFNAPQRSWSQELMKTRGAALQAIPFSRELLAPNLKLGDLPAGKTWDVYQALHLAKLMNWEMA